MAQYGEPHNSDLSQFQRYRPGAESSSQGQASNGNAAHGAAAGGDSPPLQPGFNQPPQAANPGSWPGNNAPQSSETGRSWSQDASSDWSQSLSGAARKRNQWRQFQYLKPDFGTPTPPAEPASPPPRPASLPTFTDNSRTSRPPSGGNPSTPGPVPSPSPGDHRRPASGLAGQSFANRQTPPGREAIGRLSIPQPPGSARRNRFSPAASAPSFVPSRPNARFPQGQQSLQPHPHSTALPDAAAPPNGPPRADRTAGYPPSKRRFSSKVTPLRPVPSTAGEPPGQNNAVQAASYARAEDSTARVGKDVNVPPRQSVKPRRRLGKPPMPVLYLIRLIILGVGVAAIAGTLLSVLSPSNVVSSPDQNEAAGQMVAGASAGPLVAGTTATMVSDITLTQELTRLRAEIEQLASLTPGMTQAAFMLDLDTGNYVDIAGGQAIAAASTIKVPILVAFLQEVDAGNIALNQGLIMAEDQVAGGSGTMQNDPVGSRYTALEVASQMIVTSDNTATNMMIDALGGMDVLNQRFQDWGLEATVLRNPLPDLDGTNTTSTRDLTLLMALIDQGGLLTPRSRDRMLGIMQRTVNRSLIPFGISDDSLLANKTGDIESVLGDVALVDVPNGKRYVISTLVQRPDNDGRASELIRRTAETAHTEFSQPIAPVGGVDPSVPEDAVPDPASPEEEEPPPPGEDPEADPPNREQIPQG